MRGKEPIVIRHCKHREYIFLNSDRWDRENKKEERERERKKRYVAKPDWQSWEIEKEEENILYALWDSDVRKKKIKREI